MTFVHHFLDRALDRFPDKPAVISGNRHYSYRDISERATRIASALQRAGVVRGDRVAILLDNGVEAVAAIFGIMRAGGVFMVINPQTKKDKLAYVLENSGAAALISAHPFATVYESAVAQSPACHTVLVAGQADDHDKDGKQYRSLERIFADMEAPLSDPGTIDYDLASLIYTSGSTGKPKGVMLSHINMFTAANSIATYLGLNSDDRIVCALPLAFDYGLYQVLLAFNVGATVLLEKSFAFPVKVLDLMVRERVTVLPGIPTIFTMLLNLETLPGYDLSALRLITNTAMALPVTQIADLRRTFPQARLFSMYGLTECKRVSYLPPEQLDSRPTSVGRGMPNEEVWLVDEQGRRLPNGSTGELVIRGSNVMRGYWRDPVNTAERLKPGPLPGEVVLYSGDIFRSDDEGYLYFVGRRDDLIKSRGQRVSPREIEDALYLMPQILEAAVVGVPDTLLGQAIKAFVAVRAGQTCTPRQILAHCRELLEDHMVPREVIIMDSLPKTESGKIRKTGLADLPQP
ncbi:MAG: AMP-binding protein [Steroidobacteraceae bacterium]